MRLGRATVSNYRAIKSAALDFDDVTILIGENNAGKSAFLAALDLFFAATPRVGATDYSSGNVADPIAVTIEFSGLTPAERELFANNMLGDRLIVTRAFHPDLGKDNGGYSVDRLVNAAFSACRAQDGARAKRDLYDGLRENFGLPPVARAEDIEPEFHRWEAANPSVLTRERVGGFRGFKNVASGQLKKNTDFVLVAAVKDASAEFGQSRTSPVKQLIDVVARQTIQNSAMFKEFVAEASERLRELTSPEAVPGLLQINEDLTAILTRYYGRSQISATWQPLSDIPLQMPTAEIAVTDHGYSTSIDGVGHGLQRAIILTVLEYLAERGASSSGGEAFGEAQSDIIIAIEEPELYQHPTKQRLFKDVFRELVGAFNKETGIRIQVVYTTHSALLFDFPDFEKVRAVRRHGPETIPGVKVTRSSLRDCARMLARSVGKCSEEAFGDAALLARLHVFNAEIAEGFFGRVVVLIEGPSDRAILEAHYRTLRRDPLAEGIVFANVEGKSKLDRPSVVFSALGIPTYLIFDSDKCYSTKEEAAAKIATNKQLQYLAGLRDDQIVDWPEGVGPRFASWESTIEDYLEKCAGKEAFDAVLNAVRIEFAIARKDCLKTPAVASSCLVRWKARGVSFPRLDEIVVQIDAMLRPPI